MINTFKKNQIIIFSIALMLVTIGYLNYSMTKDKTQDVSTNISQNDLASIGDATLVGTSNVIESNNQIDNKEEINDNNKIKDDKNVQETSKNLEDLNAYFTKSKLDRENMYSEMLNSHQSVLADTNASTEQKNNAQQEINNINKQKNAIMIAENLIKNKGFQDVVIFVNNESISVVVRKDKIEAAEIAQIQSIVQRELSAKLENIHISNK